MSLRFYTPIDNVQTWLTSPYSIGQTGITVASATLFGTPTSGNPTLCTVINGSESNNSATYMIREVIGVSPGNNLQLGGFLDGSLDQNINANSLVQRRVVAADFTTLQNILVSINNSGIVSANNISLMDYGVELNNPQSNVISGNQITSTWNNGQVKTTSILSSGILTTYYDPINIAFFTSINSSGTYRVRL